VRGITNAEDAVKCAEFGASAVWVTNNTHLGASPIAILRNIVSSLSGTGCEVFMSGGIRRGTDVLKALAFGATCVFLDPETPLWALF
jgi:isopentenyl diphosphate isomerase/L-lactate dehydrogenase-like FMN-dependent dehydrogenase